MAYDRFQPKSGRTRSSNAGPNLRTTFAILRQAANSARPFWHRARISPSSHWRGLGTGALAAAGLIAPGTRRVVIKTRYVRPQHGDLSAARSHLRYIQRDGVTREGSAGQVYDAAVDDGDVKAFLRRSKGDPYQFRFIVSPEDSARLADLKPFIRDLMAQMQQDLSTKLDWVAVDHYNTGHPHSHVVVRGKDVSGEDLVIARNYMTHGIRARAGALVTLELGAETEPERMAKLINEVEQERFTAIDRALLGRGDQGIVVIATHREHPLQQTTRIGRLKKLERLGLAQERRAGVWSLDPNLESKLRQLGRRADTFKMMQRALKQAGLQRPAPGLALFESGRRTTPVIGKVVAVGLVDEITDRQYVIVDGSDGRVHYADLGRLAAGEVPAAGMIVSLSSDSLQGKPKSAPRLQILSAVELAGQIDYDGPTWLDRVVIARENIHRAPTGFGAELEDAFASRGRWLVAHKFAAARGDGEVNPSPQLATLLRQREATRLTQSLSRQLNAVHVPHEPGVRISGVYERSISTPTAKLAVIRTQDTFTLAPWRPALESMRGRAVTCQIQSHHVTWMLDRGRDLPGRG